MKKELHIAVEDSETNVLERTKNYFMNQGFKLTAFTGEKMIFKRGSILLNMVTFNPLKWKSIITIEKKNAAIKAVFEINTTSQLVTFKEENLWDNFIANYKNALSTSFDYTLVNEKLVRETKVNSRKLIGPALIGGIGAGIPAGIIAHHTGLNSIVGIGAAAGAIGYLKYRTEKEKKNNAI